MSRTIKKGEIQKFLNSQLESAFVSQMILCYSKKHKISYFKIFVLPKDDFFIFQKDYIKEEISGLINYKFIVKFN